MPGAQRRLGRGLDALLPELEPRSGDRVESLACTAIERNPLQPRRTFAAEGLAELAESIRTHGVLQPVIVRVVGQGRYQLVAGERRWRAAQSAGLAEVPALVRELSDAEVAEIALIENLQREDLNPLEEAEALRRLIEDYGLSQEELARRLGRSRPAISNSLRLLHAPEAVRAAVVDGRLSAGHARALLALEGPTEQAAAVEQVVGASMSVRATEDFVRRLQRPPGDTTAAASPRASMVRTADWRDAECRLREALGTRVRIRGDGRQGMVEVAFFGAADLERLLEMLAPVSRETDGSGGS